MCWTRHIVLIHPANFGWRFLHTRLGSVLPLVALLLQRDITLIKVYRRHQRAACAAALLFFFQMLGAAGLVWLTGDVPHMFLPAFGQRGFFSWHMLLVGFAPQARIH
jgi:hypothetical protein